MIFSHIDINEKTHIFLGIYKITKALFEHKDNQTFACHVNNTVYSLSGNTTLQKKSFKVINNDI